MFYFGKGSISRLEKKIDPVLQEIFKKAIEISPVDFGIPVDGGHRTADRQNSLFLKGASKCDGYVKKSNHQSGKALDFYAYVGGHSSYNKAHLSVIAGILIAVADGYGVKLRSGATFGSVDWSGWDFGHIEIV